MVSRNDGKKAGRSGWALGLGAGALVVCVAMILYGVFGTPPLRDHTADDSGDKPQNTAVTTETVTNAAAKETQTGVASTDTGTDTPTKGEPASTPGEQIAATEPDQVEITPDPQPDPAPQEPQATDDNPVETLARPKAVQDTANAPSFDVVRVDPDGGAVIAGQADPGSKVTILLDDASQDSVKVGEDGKFVSLLDLPRASSAQVLSLRIQSGENQIDSEEQIILAPVVAAIEEEPAETPEPTPEKGLVPAPETEKNDLAVAPEREEDAPAAPAPALAPAAEPLESAPETAVLAQTDAVRQPEQTEPAPEDITQTTPLADPTAPATPQIEAAAPQEPAAPDPAGQAASLADTAPELSVDGKPARAPAPVAVLHAGRDGIDVLQPAARDTAKAPVALALDAISYSASGDVTLTGRARLGSVVRVYLNNRLAKEIGTDGNGRWSGALEDVAPGVYTLRFDELDSAGKVLGRLETPFKREAPEILQAKNPATGQPGSPSATRIIQAVTVQAGDSLWAISQERYGSGFLYLRLFDANRDAIRNPDLIYPGQVFTVPE